MTSRSARPLTHAEKRILEMTEAGVSDWDIARAFKTSIESVRSMRYHARRKLGLPSFRGGWGLTRKARRGGAVLEAREKGLSIAAMSERFGITKKSVSIALWRANKARLGNAHVCGNIP